MKFMLLIYTDEAAHAQLPAAELEAEMAAYFAFNEETAKAGVLIAGDALHPVTTATTVRVRDGKTLTTDGPFAETKEQLGGYYVLDCKDVAEAAAWAAKIPSTGMGCIEIRALVVFE
jgi:hypothetical protein